MTTNSFCNEACESGWEADRAAGVIYPQVVVDEMFFEYPEVMVWPSGTRTVSWKRAAGWMRFCMYCGDRLEDT